MNKWTPKIIVKDSNRQAKVIYMAILLKFSNKGLPKARIACPDGG